MLNNYADSGGGFNSNHGQTSRPAEPVPKQHNIGSTWSSYNNQLEGMYYGSEQAMYMGPYDGSSKHANYPQYPHQPVPTPVVKCQEACCQHFQDRYPLNPAPLRYQPTQPRYDDSRQYFADRRSMQPTLSRKKAYPTDNAFSGIPDRHYSQFMGRGQFMPDSRQQMQMMRSQYPMYPPYWGSARGYGPRMNCPPPPYHQSVSQGAQLQAGLKVTDAHYMDPTQKSLGSQRHRTVVPSAGSEIIRPVPEPKRSTLDSNLQSCYEFGYTGGFVPFGEVNKIQGTNVTQNGSSSCKIPNDKQYHPHQMQYSMQASDRNMMNCSNPINDLSYSMNFPLQSGDPYIRAGLDDGQPVSDSRKLNLQYDSSSLGKKRPDLDLRQYLATWEDDEEEGTRLSEPVTLGNSGAPYIVVDCRSLEGEAAAKIQERFKNSQNCGSKSRSSSPNSDCKRTDEQTRPGENSENSNLATEFQNQTSFAPSMPNLLNESDKGVNFWNGTERDGEPIGKGSAFQPLDCSKRDNNLDHSKRDPQTQSEIPTSKIPSNNEPGNMSFDNLVSYYGDSRRISDGGYDFVEMTERLVNNPDKSAVNNHQIPPAMTRPCDPRLQQSQIGNNPSIYNKVAPRYSSSNFQHFKPPMPPDPYYNFKHPMNPSKYFGYESSQVIDPNYEYHKIASEFDPARLYPNKDAAKDPRRLFHLELEKAAEGAFLDPLRKAQLNDCYQDKAPCEFTNADPDQFTSPIIVKKSDLTSRDKVYSDKSNSIRERMDVINNENETLPEKTVLITSQNGPPEIFRVPYSPEKDLSHKDNVVTLHSGDQNKSNTITVEVPYVQQYSTLVKLSEEISRAENVDGKIKSKKDDSNSSNKSINDETKKPTSFKLKRLPNSKEWAVENKRLSESNKRGTLENNTLDSEKMSSCEVFGERESLKASVTVSNLNMPSLDDFREEENRETVAENLSKNKIIDNSVCASKICSDTVDDSSKINKYNSQTPQMAIVQPMKMNKCDGNKLESDQTCKLSKKDYKDQLTKPVSSIGVSDGDQNSFDPEKLISSTSSHLELMPESDISKHENFRTHKKIQSFPTRIPNCLPSPSEEFLHSQEIGAESQKEPYSPFQVYSDCDMNSQISEFFKMDDRNASSEKILDSRMPSSPGVEGMFEDINHSNPNNTYQPKACDFPDLTDSSINNHNAHFQSFSTIFSDDAERRARLDGSVLQMNDKKCLKHILEDINNEELTKSGNSTEQRKSDDPKKSPTIPPISLKLKLNESKKMWCIANKNQHLSDPTNDCPNELPVNSRSLSHDTLDIDAANELEKDLAQAIDEEKRKSSKNYFGEVQSYSEINQLLSNGTSEDVTSHIMVSGSNILAESILNEQNSLEYAKVTKIDPGFSGNTGNKCLTITKYCPRNKIFERISSIHMTQSKASKTLVFDEFGTHFPVTREATQDEAKSIAKDIIEDLILKFITDRYVIGKNNVAHVAPFCGTPSYDYHHDESTNTCVSTASMTDSHIKYENSHVLKDMEEKDSSIIKTTEMFILTEKKYYQHHTVIKTITSANNIVSKLRRPARSIFSPMSDHGKEDDEPIESVCDKELHQTVSNQEENLLYFGKLKCSNQVDCFDLENVHEDHLMDVDLGDHCSKVNQTFASEITLDQSAPANDIKAAENESLESSSNPNLHNIGNCAENQNGTEIDDALELMGLSNTKSIESYNDNTQNSNSSKGTIENSLLYLQESSENDSAIEDQLAAEKDGANRLLFKQLSKNSKKENYAQEQPLPLQTEYLKGLEETGTSVESDMFEYDTHNDTQTEVSNTRTSNLKGDDNQIDVSYVSERLFVKPTQLVSVKINSEECIVNDILLPQSPCEGLPIESEPIKTISDDSNDVLTSIVAESKDDVSSFSDTEVIRSDDKNTGQTHVEDIESRLETSVIVRNETFNSVSSRNVSGQFQSTLNYPQESFKNDTETVFNVRNIIDEVINYAVSNDVSQHQYYLKGPLQNYQNEIIKCSGGTSLMEEVSPFKSMPDKMDCSQETFLKCSFQAKNMAMNLSSELSSERTQFSVDEKTSVITSTIVLPLDLTSRTVSGNGFSEKCCYCVSELISMSEEEETSLFVKITESSYFNEFKKRKWQRFHKSFFKKDCSEHKDHLTSENKINDRAIVEFSLNAEQKMLPAKENVCSLDSNNCLSGSQSGLLVPPYSPSCSETEMDDELYSENISKQNLSSKRFFGDSKKEFSRNEVGNTKQTSSDIANDRTIKLGDDIYDESQVQDCSIPLKDKVHFYNKKEAHSFLRRDSLRLLEREAVLREIFSPDPEIDYSESKENECPGNYDQHKQDGGLKPVDCESIVPNAVLSSPVNVSSKPNAISGSESQYSFPQTAQEDPNQKIMPHFSLEQTVNVGSQPNKMNLPSDELDVKDNDIPNKSYCQETEFLDAQSQSDHNACALDQEEHDLEDPTSPCYTSYLSQQASANDQDYVGHQNKKTLTKHVSSSTILPSHFHNMNSLVEKSIGEVSKLSADEKITKEVSNNEKTPTVSFSESGNVTSFQPAIKNTGNVSSRSMSPERSPLLCQDKEILLPDQEEVTHGVAMNGAHVNKTTISYCQDSNTNDISSKVAQNEDANSMSLVTGKDVLFSTTQTSDDQDDEALSSNLHHKGMSDREVSDEEDEREDINSAICQNDKISSVQDSLRNNHHLNRETFPLQCLVEAALALEHVDSKQILLNNSNFPGLYSQSDEGFVESPLSDSPSHETLEYSTKSNATDETLDTVSKKKSLQNDLTLADREIFSKFEETNYNLRASTRIVTSSSNNIIPYSKRKYGLKSAKSLSATSEIKQKKVESPVSDKIKSKKRRSVFAYPRSKRRRKNNKDKQKSPDVLIKPINQNNTEIPLESADYEPIQNKIDKENILGNRSDDVEACLSKEIGSINYSNHCSHFKSNSQLEKSSSHLAAGESKNDFGGPLLISGENTTPQGNIFCVHVDSEKIDDYVNTLHVDGLGLLSDNNHSLFKDSNSDCIGSGISNVSLENGTSLVIIIEDLDDNTGKIEFDDNCKSESDVMLGSVRDADCSDVLTTELSVNESCICPPDIGMKGTCESELKSKLSFGRNDELLTTNCYEEINENLINDIGNWPFVEEEVAEFDNKSEFPNKIPEEGRKIELKCSLPWKKIFNISKNMTEKQEKKQKRKNKASRKPAGLELGPANVEVRLKAPSAEWKVISDYHENSSPVVKVSRLILQRESDNSSCSYSEKDSEEENDLKKQPPECNDLNSNGNPNSESYLTENISKNENWQPIVVLKRSKELDELTARLQSQTFSSLSNSQSSSSDEGNDQETSEDSDSDTSDIVESNHCSYLQSRDSSSSCDLFENKDPTKKYYQSKFCKTNENDRVPYEKYSPTGCSNSLANEKIYSPSNPHFSPGEVYPDSDLHSECGGDNVLSNNDNGGDVFLEQTTHTTNPETQIITENTNIGEIDTSHSQNADRFEEEIIDTNMNKHLNKTETLPQGNLIEEFHSESVPSNDYLSDFNHTSPLKGNSDDELGRTTVDYKSSAYSNSSSTSNEVNNTYETSREFSYDQTKKTKRKMPKNFFVRKKVRRNKSEIVSSNSSSQGSEAKMSTIETLFPVALENSPSSLSIAHNELQYQKHSLNEENEQNSEGGLSVTCDNSRLQCVYNLEDSSPTRLKESALLPERFEVKRTLRNRGRGLKRPGEGHSREDTKRRRKKLISLSNTCQECDVTFKNKEELTRHNAYRHARRRELHHCLLCQRSFSSAARHSLHVQGRSHRHLELTQRHTMHMMHRMLAGGDCAAIPPLTRAEQRALQWRPSQPGYTHIYHDLTPLQTVLQEQSSDSSEDTIMSGEKIGND